MRCNSSNDLFNCRSVSGSSSLSSFTALSSALWHRRLGHPSSSILSTLSHNRLIFCIKIQKYFCSSCPLRKHIKFLFKSFVNSTYFSFDVIQSDIWTSFISSSCGYRYYVLFVDDFTNFLRTFSISHKSQVSSIFINFHTYVITQFERPIKNLRSDNGTEFANRS